MTEYKENSKIVEERRSEHQIDEFEKDRQAARGMTEELNYEVVAILKKYGASNNMQNVIIREIHKYLNITKAVMEQKLSKSFFMFLKMVNDVAAFPITVDEMSSLIVRLDFTKEDSLCFLLSFLKRYPGIISEESFGMILSLANDILDPPHFVEFLMVAIEMHYEFAIDIRYASKAFGFLMSI